MNTEKYNYILTDKKYMELHNIPRHGCTNTYDHSMKVAEHAEKLSKIFFIDPDSAIKTALLHDFCLVDYSKKNDHPGLYAFYHPKEAAENSEKFGLSEKELKAIKTHMFPLGPIPVSRLGWVIRIADISASLRETSFGIKMVKSWFKAA